MDENPLPIPEAESGAFLVAMREEFGEEYVATDVSRVWTGSWVRFLGDFDPSFYRVIGNRLIPAHHDNDLGFSDTGFISLEYEKVRMVILQFPRGYGEVRMVYTAPEAATKVRDLVRHLVDAEHKARELSIWGGRDIPLDKLDTANFVVPKVVETAFASEVYPQLDDGEIFNHVLLYSSPGVGKTAFCRVLAKQFPDWKTIIVFPSAVDKPRELMHAFDYAAYRTPAILIFEDIDAWAQTRFEEATYKEDFSPFLGALLNGVDGIESHQGLLVISTTNNPECLDPAILRPGRFGVQVEFRYTDEELARICSNYLGEERPDDFFRPYLRNTPAHIRALMKTARAYHKLHGVPVTHELLKEIDTLLRGSPKLPKPEDMFVRDEPEEAVEEKAYG